MNIMDIWRSGLVRRWHCNPDLAHTGQTNGHHQWGVSIIALYLFGNDIDLIKASILHDVSEVGIGDVSGLAKRNNPKLRIAINEAEVENAKSLGIEYVSTDRLKLCDMIDAYLWASHHSPHIMNNLGWPEQLDAMIDLADRLGVKSMVEHMIFEGRMK